MLRTTVMRPTSRAANVSYDLHSSLGYIMNKYAVVKVIMACLLSAASLSAESASAQEWQVKGEYRNPALGYSIRIPRGLVATTGVSGTGVQRGVDISLQSGGAISVWGEPNSLEWKNPSEGVQWALENGECTSKEAKPSQVLIGRTEGAQTRVACKDQVRITFLAFRSSGGPIYWFVLTSSSANEREDKAIFEQIIGSFRIIRWK
jgi:hypothetical protein